MLKKSVTGGGKKRDMCPRNWTSIKNSRLLERIFFMCPRIIKNKINHLLERENKKWGGGGGERCVREMCDKKNRLP